METCVRPVALTPISKPGCPFKFDQIVRMLLYRGTADQPFATEAEIKALATWTPLLVAGDDNRIIVTPLFAGLTIPASEGIYEGGNDNSTIDGVEVYKGETAPRATGGTFRNLTPTVKKEMALLSAESDPSLGADGLRAIFVNRFGKLILSTGFEGIPVYSFRIGSTGSEGFGADNINTFEFSFPSGWDENVIMVEPSFNPRTAF